MLEPITVLPTTSIQFEVVPAVKKFLENDGFALVVVPKSNHLMSELLAIGSVVGCGIANHVSYSVLEGDSDPNKLAVHTEGISYTCGIVPYFALGCLLPSVSGGETRIFDAKKAALLVRERGLSDVVIEYGSLAHPDQVIRHSLVVNTPYGDVLRYRASVQTNKLITAPVSLDQMYSAVDEVLENCVSYIHVWSAGDLLFINNNITLHDRLSYVGKRSMLRIRYDDGLHRNFSF